MHLTLVPARMSGAYGEDPMEGSGKQFSRTQIKIFVLNLDRVPDRRTAMLERLAALGLEGEIISAIDGKQLNASDLPAGTETALSPGEIGCYLSHIGAWETIIARRLPYAIVLEDDVVLKSSLMNVVEEVIALGMPFDAVRLSALNRVYGIPVASLSAQGRLVLTTRQPSGAQGYLVSLKGAKRLFAKFSVPKMPIDEAMDRYWKFGLSIPVLFPAVVEEDKTFAGTIITRIRDTQRETLMRRVSHRVEKRICKVAVFFMARRLLKFGLLKVRHKIGKQV